MKKVKDAEEAGKDPNLRLNKEAASRFIKAALSDQGPGDTPAPAPAAAADGVEICVGSRKNIESNVTPGQKALR